MANLTPQQIGAFGEKHVADALRQTSHTGIKVNTQSPGSTDIETDNVLVQVKTAVAPNNPGYPSSDEIRNIKSRATKIGKNAHIAQVTINSDGSLAKQINWTNL